MPETLKPTIVCQTCGAEKTSAAFYVDPDGYQRRICTPCMSEASRRRYHTNPRARAMQVACSAAEQIKRKFPEAATGLTNLEYVQTLLGAAHCHYCALPNDGTHPFNLDHRVALGNGGRHELANLVPCCEPCNRAKRDMPAEVFMAWLQGVAQRLTLSSHIPVLPVSNGPADTAHD